MPFLKVQFEGEQLVVTNSFGIKPSEVPVFFLPGILGNGSEFQEFAWTMHESGDKHPLYVWYDPLIVQDKKHPYKENPTLEDIGKLAAEEMVDLFPTGPFLVVGNSDGCIKSLSAGQFLKVLGLYVSLFLIDGTSPACTRHYFSNPSQTLRNDLLDVVNYAVRLSTLHPNENDDEIDFNFTTEDNHRLASLDLKDPINFIETAAKMIVERERSIDKELFDKFIKIAKQRIKDHVGNHPEKSSEIKLDKIVALITKETADKYGNEYGGWDKYTNKLSLVADDLLRTQKHMSLLREPENLENLVRNILSFIKQETHPANLLSLQLNYLYQMYSTEHSCLQEQLNNLPKLSKSHSNSQLINSGSQDQLTLRKEELSDDNEKENHPANIQLLPIIEKFSSDDNKKMEKNKLEPDQFLEHLRKAQEILKEKIYKNNKCFMFQSCKGEQQHIKKQALIKNSPIKVNS